MAPSVYLFFYFSGEIALMKCWPLMNYLSMIKFWEWLVGLQRLGIVLIHLYDNFQPEGGSQINGSHLRVASHLGTPAYSIWKLHGYLLSHVALTYCSMYYWILGGIWKPQTLGSAATHSAIWATGLQCTFNIYNTLLISRSLQSKQ